MLECRYRQTVSIGPCVNLLLALPLIKSSPWTSMWMTNGVVNPSTLRCDVALTPFTRPAQFQASTRFGIEEGSATGSAGEGHLRL